MAAERQTLYTHGQYPPITRSARGKVTEDNDFFVLPEWGADILAVNGQAGPQLGWQHGTITVNLLAGYDTDDVSIVFDGGTAGYLGTAAEIAAKKALFAEVAGTGELLQVRRVTTADGGVTGTIVVSRGALCSTPAAIANDTVLYLKNVVVMTDDTVAEQVVAIHYIPWSQDYGGARHMG